MREEVKDTTQEPAGVPLGGLGAGCIELGRDGRFRNITINNNRTSEERIDVSEGAFLAVRAARRGKVRARILQTGSGLPFDEAGIVPPYTPLEDLSWNGLYPCSHYRIEDRQFPLDVNWTGMSPVIPYDVDAASLPLMFMTVYCRNTTSTLRDVSVVFNWENLCGCIRDQFPEHRGPIRPVVVASDEYASLEVADGELDKEPKIAGLEFGFRGECRTNAEGNYTLVAKQQQDVAVSVMAWNERNPRELQVFWDRFHDEGDLGNKISKSEQSHSGAVCCSFSLEPQQGRSVVFIFSWYCPKYEVHGEDYGNAYTNSYDGSLAIASRALRYFRYYFDSVQNWQNRITSSSLPRWFSRLLINNNYVFSTNTLLTRGGHFAMMETPADPLVGSLDRRLHSSLASLLFFPEFETRELGLFVGARDPHESDRPCRYLGRACVGEPGNADSPAPLQDLAPKLVLMVFRNYTMTGKLFVLESLYPRLKQIMTHMLKNECGDNGLPDAPGTTTTYDQWPIYGANSYTAGLWVAAMRAFVKMARRMKDDKEAERYERLVVKAVKHFEADLWSDKLGYYRFYSRDGEHRDACHCAQLAGQWYAEFLCLGRFLPDERVRKALGAIGRLNEKKHAVAKLVTPDGDLCQGVQGKASGDAWPAFYTTHYCCLLMSNGYADRALYILQKTYKNIQGRRGRTFNQPLGWNLETNDAEGWAMDRHMGAPSVWHLFFALLGFSLSLPDQTLWIRPNLPRGVHHLNAPLFTPVCLGWLKFREEDLRAYLQQVQISFDSPITIKTIVLRIPKGVEDVEVTLSNNGAKEDTEHLFGYDGSERLVEIILERPITISEPIVIALRQTKGKRVRFDRVRKESRK